MYGQNGKWVLYGWLHKELRLTGSNGCSQFYCMGYNKTTCYAGGTHQL